MDQALKDKREDFTKALLLLAEVLAKDVANDIFMRAAAVKHFEMCFELCWKTAKEFVLSKFGDNILSPKETFRALQKYGAIGAEETELMLKMVQDRNLTAHTYEEEFITALAARLPEYYQAMRAVEAAVRV